MDSGVRCGIRTAAPSECSLPPTDSPWDDRQPFTPAEEAELEPVPGHYKHFLGLPVEQKSSPP